MTIDLDYKLEKVIVGLLTNRDQLCCDIWTNECIKL